MMKDMGFNYREVEESRKKFVRYKDGCKVYGMGISKFQEIVYSDSYEPPARSFRTRLTKDKNQIHENCTAA